MLFRSQYGLAAGLVTPLLRSLIFAMPPIYPTAVSMAFELAAYGVAAGALYRRLPKNTAGTYISLISAMVFGRLVWGGARYVMLLAAGTEFSWELFVAGAFVTAAPGIILQLVLIPALILLLRKNKLISQR